MPGLVPGIHVLAALTQQRRGWPGRQRPKLNAAAPLRPLPAAWFPPRTRRQLFL